VFPCEASSRCYESNLTACDLLVPFVAVIRVSRLYIFCLAFPCVYVRFFNMIVNFADLMM
jgi:hypothetical protein